MNEFHLCLKEYVHSNNHISYLLTIQVLISNLPYSYIYVANRDIFRMYYTYQSIHMYEINIHTSHVRSTSVAIGQNWT